MPLSHGTVPDLVTAREFDTQSADSLTAQVVRHTSATRRSTCQDATARRGDRP